MVFLFERMSVTCIISNEAVKRQWWVFLSGKAKASLFHVSFSISYFFPVPQDFLFNIFFQRDKISGMEDCLVMISEGSGQSDAFMLTPLGTFDVETLRRIIDRVRPVFEDRGLAFRILCIDGSQLPVYEKLGMPGAVISYNDDFSDYLYNAEDLRTLKGRRYSGKRNHLSHFLKSHPDFEYGSLGPELFEECLELTREWASARDTDIDDADLSDYHMIETVFNNWDRIKCRGGVIRISGKVRAFSIGSVYKDTAYIHFEKADTAYDGLYVAINRFTIENEFPEAAFVNREEDLGIEGLRKAKESYYPCDRVRKYKVTF